MSERFLGRFIASAFFVVVAAGSWDVWWHGAIGRDSFWEPPHLLLQAGVLAALIASIYGWVRTRDRAWAYLAIACAIVPVSAPFDELWHRAFGVENLSSPLVIWSPPHLALVGSLIAGVLLVLPILRRDEAPGGFFISLGSAAFLVLTLFLVVPLEPLGAYHLLGFAGAGAQGLVLALVFLMAAVLIPGVGAATMTVAFFLTLNSLNIEGRLAPGVIVPPHAHPPAWLLVFSFILVAVLSDAVRDRWASHLTGALIGFLTAAIIYGLAPSFIEPSFRFGLAAATTAIVAATLGGSIGGFLGARIGQSLARVGHLADARINSAM